MNSETVQLQLPFITIKRGDRKTLVSSASIDDRFYWFHALNPSVYEALKQLALDAKRRGVKRYGMKALFEVLRYSHTLRTLSDDFKLNNDFTSRYARMLMENEPELKGFFEKRELKSLQQN